MIVSIIKQIAVFSIFILIGLLLRKVKVLPQNSNDVISKLETKLFLPVYVSAMPIGLNVVVFLQDDSGDAYLGARYCFTSVLFSTVTIPVLYYLMTRIGVML